MTTTTPQKLLAAVLALALVGSVFAIGGAVAGQTDGDPATENGPATDDEPDAEDDDADAGNESDADDEATDDGLAGDDEPDADDGPDTQQTTYLRVVHASPDAPAVDVAVDNETVLTDVAFGDVSDYLALEAGTYNVTISAADDPETVVFDDEVTLDPRSATTLAAAGEIGENASTTFEPLLYDDDALEPEDDESAISVIHLSPDAPAVDVTTGNGSVVLAENVSYGNASDYATVPEGDYTVEIREAAEDNNGTVVTTEDVSLEGGTAYSALAVGYLDAGNETDDNESVDNAFEVVTTEDATWSVELPGDATPVDANETDDEETPTEAETPADEDETETPEEDDDETPTETESDDEAADDETPMDADDEPTTSE